MTNTYKHPDHHHPLVKVERDSTFRCYGCKTKGIGQRYRCSKKCGFELHRECMRAPSKITFEGKKCRFYRKPLPCRSPNCPNPRKDYCTDCRSCDACGKTVRGFVYHCSDTGWDLHPRCANLQSKLSTRDVTFWLKKQGRSTCAWCHKKRLEGAVKRIPGWSYVSNQNEISFHVYCVMEMGMHVHAISKGDSASSSLALAPAQGMNLLLRAPKNGGTTNSRQIWLDGFKILIKSVCFLSDPTGLSAVVISSMEHLFNVFN